MILGLSTLTCHKKIQGALYGLRIIYLKLSQEDIGSPI